MTATREILNIRLDNQLLSDQKYPDPQSVVRHMGAMQAQDYSGSLWAIGIRTGASTEAEIEKYIAGRKIVRTWPMRGTLHFVAPEDVRWMLKLLTPRILAGQEKRFKRVFDLDTSVLDKSKDLLIRAIEGGKQLKRDEIYRALEEGGIHATGQRGLHIIWYLAQQGLLCFGPRNGKQPVFVLLDEWIPETVDLSQEESLAEITFRYFNSRGPAMITDFIWWSGLTVKAAKTGIELVKTRLEYFKWNGGDYWMSPQKGMISPKAEFLLLPAFDEYLISYKDRSLMLGIYNMKDVVPYSNGMFFPVIVENGCVTGTWKRTLLKKSIQMELKPFVALNKQKEEKILKEWEKYKRFLRQDLI